MFVVIGNVIAGLGVVGLFTATLRLSGARVLRVPSPPSGHPDPDSAPLARP
jgi:hypothetical protein